MNLEFEFCTYELYNPIVTYTNDRKSYEPCIYCKLDERETMKDPNLHWDRYRLIDCRHVMHTRCARDCWIKAKCPFCPICGPVFPLMKRHFEEVCFELSERIENFNIGSTFGKKMTESDSFLINKHIKDSFENYGLPSLESMKILIALQYTSTPRMFVTEDEHMIADTMYHYKENGLMILPENIFKIDINDKTYHLAIIQYPSKKKLKKQSLCPLAICCGIKARGNGILFKTRESADKALYYLLGYRSTYRSPK